MRVSSIYVSSCHLKAAPLTLRASLSGEGMRKDVENQCLEFALHLCKPGPVEEEEKGRGRTEF